MRFKSFIHATLLFVLVLQAIRKGAAAEHTAIHTSMPAQQAIPLRALEAEARARVHAQPRVTVDSSGEGLVQSADDLELAGSNHIPNYVKAFSDRPGVPATVAHLMRVVLYSGQVRPELKMAVGIRVAQLNDSPYVAAYLEHLLRATPSGSTLLTRLRSGDGAQLPAEENAALGYAADVSSHAASIQDAKYRAVRGFFNDSQMVDLTLSVCFFNYLTRVANAFNLPVEEWALSTAAAAPKYVYEEPKGRIAVLDDSRMALLSKEDPAFKNAESRGESSMGIGLPHGERIMLWTPDVPQAWWDYGRVLGPSVTLPRILLRYTSLAVSAANGCRYCTLHVLLGMKRAGVDPAKLVEMKTDDSVLSTDERTVVEFARKLTRAPASVSDLDYKNLVRPFGDKGAADIVLQTSYFAFMNRFNDAMDTPSEDLALQNYHNLYGSDWQP